MVYSILEGKATKQVDVYEWITFDAPVVVKQTELPDAFVSTVFIGLGILPFETMVFGGEHNEYTRRYATWEQAEAGHQQAINLIFNVEECK